MAEKRNVTPSPPRMKHTIDERALQVTSVFAKTGDHAVLDHEADEDEKILLALGYRQKFKRFVLGADIKNPTP